MTSDLLEENQDLRKQVADLEKENAELKEKNEGYCRSRDRLISIGFPTFKDCKEYAEHLTKAKEIIEKVAKMYRYSPRVEEIIEQAEQFLSEVEK